MIANKADKVLRQIEELTRQRFLPIIGRKKGRILSNTIRRYKPKRILEVGTLIGYSSILMGKDLDENSEIITIEYDEDEAIQARKNISKAELRPSVKVLVGDALNIIPELEGGFDMVFLDAEKHQYLDYLKLVEDKLHKGSVVVADNVGLMRFSIKKYIKYVRSSGRYESRFYGNKWDGIELSIKL